MKQLTIRGFDKELELEIRRLANKENISLNKAVLRILHRGVRTADAPLQGEVIGSGLDYLAGTWTDEDLRTMDEVIKDFERIDPELWS